MKRMLACLMLMSCVVFFCSCGGESSDASPVKNSPELSEPAETLDVTQVCDALDGYIGEAEASLAAVTESLNKIEQYSGIAQDAVINDTMGIALDAKSAIRDIYDRSEDIENQAECADGFADYYDCFKDVLGSALIFSDKVKEFCKDPSQEMFDDCDHAFNVYLASKLNYVDAQNEYIQKNG